MMTDVDVLVVGGGPGGLSAAVQAQELGAKVTPLEAEQIGGTSVNRGAQKVCRQIGTGQFPAVWSYLGPEV
jgi:pyruvate/2-oxoglutarate dehydrogenase complex dihydrolipoamide dehydrogenase (E3) component